jgi:extracellular matrix regulatory protein A
MAFSSYFRTCSRVFPFLNQKQIMDIKLINIGFGNIVSANRVIAIVSPESAPIKRIITEARERGELIDATYGRRTRAVIVTDSGHVVLSAIQPETVANRFVVSKENMVDA